MSDLEARVTVLEEAVLAVARAEELGDKEGHPFRGNQWDGRGGSKISNPAIRAEANRGGMPTSDDSGDDYMGRPHDVTVEPKTDAPFPQADPDRTYGLSPSHRTREYVQDGRIMGGEMRGGAAAILPTGKSINPVKVKGEYFENVRDGVTHIVDVGRKPKSFGERQSMEGYKPNLRAVSSYGDRPTWNVGDNVYMNHDQNPGRSLVPAGNYQPESGKYGTARVVGTRHQDGRLEGNVPNKSMPHWVFK
jgi:hypothetical protein